MASTSSVAPPRVAAWKAAVKTLQLDAVILMAPQWVMHATGVNAIINSMPSIAIITPDKPIVVLVNALRVPRALETAFPGIVIYGYGKFFGNPSIANSWQEAVGIHLKKHDMQNASIGYMADGVSAKQLKTLETCAPDATFDDVEEQLTSLRHIKDADEIEMIRIAGEFANAGARAGIEAIENGGSEIEVTDATNAAMAAYRRKHYPNVEVSDFGNPHGALFNGNQSWCLSGPRTKVSCDAPSARVPQDGERVFLLIWANAGGYHAEKELMWFKGGKIPRADLELMEDVRTAMEAMYATIKPGALLANIHSAGEKLLFSQDWEGWTASRNGHSIGLDAHEEPSLSNACPLRLKPGMIITVEPNVSKRDHASTRISETLLITEKGYDFITDPSIGNNQVLELI